MTAALVPLAIQPDHVSWPTMTWATGPQLTGDPDAVDDVIRSAFDRNPNTALALSLATVVVQGGRIVAERYGPGTDAFTPLVSWSTAKSLTDVAIGVLASDGLIALDEPAPVPEWAASDDPRHPITVRQLLQMRSGLEFNEDYVDAATSHCLEMLFGVGADDVAGYAASQRLLHEPGSRWNYSSGTTCILARIIGDTVSGETDGSPDARREATRAFLQERIFGPIGMRAEPRFDAVGTWVGSSYVYASARDFAKFGLLAARDGVWDGERIVPAGWIDTARTSVSIDPDGDVGYGEQWWIGGPEDHPELGTFWANGYEGQRIMVVPALDLVVVRLGKTPIEHRRQLLAWYRDLIDCFLENSP